VTLQVTLGAPPLAVAGQQAATRAASTTPKKEAASWMTSGEPLAPLLRRGALGGGVAARF
jgi:hypothetical protein